MERADPPASPAPEDDAARLRRCAARVRDSAWLKALTGVVPEGIDTPFDLSDPRLRWLHDHPRWRHMLQPTPFARFWLREVSSLAILCALALRSAQLNGIALPVTLAELVRLSGLAVATVHEMLEAAAARGDIVKRRSGADARFLVVDVSEGILAELEARNRQYFALIARFTGRPDPAPRLAPAAWRALSRLLLEAARNSATGPNGPASGGGRRTFLYLMSELFVAGPQPSRSLATTAAAWLGVTPATVRNVLARARRDGWLEPGAPLVPTPMARERFGFMLATLEARWIALLEAGEILARDPSLHVHLAEGG
jgi:DNA-binding MarR family transcriptional regulator